MKKARANWEAMQPYFDNIQTTVHHVLKHTDNFSHPYFDNGCDKPESQKKYGYIVVSGDKGMCGSYNHNIVKFAEAEISKHKNAYTVSNQIKSSYVNARNAASTFATIFIEKQVMQ